MGFSEQHAAAEALSQALGKWDASMVQRLSKAYDDVENYVNGFTAEYLTALNHADSPIPMVNEGTKNKIAELDSRWAGYKAEALELINVQVPAFNEKLRQVGVGALYFPGQTPR